MEITYKDFNILSEEQVKNLYQDASWSNYLLDIKNTMSGIQKSSTVFSAWNQNQLVGMIRGLSDDHTVCYIQDILVLKQFQRQGIGKTLLDKIVKKYPNVKRFVLLTDLEGANEFYLKCGFSETKQLQMVSYVKIIE